MLRVKATDHTGRAVAFACGTAEQAVAKVHDLKARGYLDITIIGQDGKEISAAALERMTAD